MTPNQHIDLEVLYSHAGYFAYENLERKNMNARPTQKLLILLTFAISFLPRCASAQERQNELNDELLRASFYGRLQEVKHALRKGADINTLDESGVCSRYPTVCAKTPTPLMCAINGEASYEDKLAVVKFLISEKANVDKQDKEGWTALMCAEGKTEIMQALIEAGASVNIQNHNGSNALSLTRGKPESEKILKAAGALPPARRSSESNQKNANQQEKFAAFASKLLRDLNERVKQNPSAVLGAEVTPKCRLDRPIVIPAITRSQGYNCLGVGEFFEFAYQIDCVSVGTNNQNSFGAVAYTDGQNIASSPSGLGCVR